MAFNLGFLSHLFSGGGFRSLKSFGRRVEIEDGNDQPLTSTRAKQTFVLGKGDASEVADAPLLTIDDRRVTFKNAGTASTTGDTATVDVRGDGARIKNLKHGEILAEDTAIEVSGRGASIHNSGQIDGGINGVNFANGGGSSGSLRNFGTVSSDSRALNIGGDGIAIKNYGDIIGTGDQRNGTIYSDGTAENYSIANYRHAEIDAGEGNQGAGIALQTGDVVGDVVRASITNYGTIEGRGQAAANTGLAGDGVRIFSGVEGGGTTFKGSIYNNGEILSESEQGPTSALRISNGLAFDGKIVNGSHGLIDGANNGLYFGDAEHDAQVKNYGTIQSDSRAVNIDGSGVDLHNFGDILGTGHQRNGTVYSDATAEDYSIVNYRRAEIDAGEGNQGAGIALQTGDIQGDVVEASITNYGTIEGRGQAAANTGLAGDGVRIFSGVEGGGTTFKGSIYNNGEILSESEQGPTSALRISNGLAFDGKIVNGSHGLIDGANNGLYFGDAEHDAQVKNYGTIQSDSRAFNIDGSGVDLHNFGDILGTDDQRNGTVYSDATAEDFSIVNHRHGRIDAGEGNEGAGISLQTGDTAGDEVEAEIVNYGKIVGRGAGQGNLTGDAIRVSSGAAGDETTLKGDIVNKGLIYSESAAGVRFAAATSQDGVIRNDGKIEGALGIDTSEASGDFTVLNNGRIIGDVRFGAGNDRYEAGQDGQVEGEVQGGLGNDSLIGGDKDDILVGGGGADTLIGGDGNDVIRGGGGQDVTDGGDGIDTADFSDIGAPVVANLGSGLASYAPNPAVTIVEQLQNFENLTGSENRDQLFGDAGNNVLKGLDGHDQLVGGGGADTLQGGDGNDLLRGGGGPDVTDGGDGIDTADFSDIGSAITADLSAGTASYAGPAGTVTDSLVSIENLRGSANDDSLSGDDGDNVIGGGLGGDHLIGGGGNDVLRGDELGLGTALQVTVENLLAPGGTFLTPVWFGFHDGVGFDLFDLASPASQGLERLAEDGTIDPISAEFLAAAGLSGVDGAVFGLGAGVPGPIDPGETASAIINVDDPAGAQFFTWATMVIPSNDAFLATTDDPQGEQVFDADGNFLGPISITRIGADVLDAGTEANTEEGAAFLNQTAPDQGTPEGGTVELHPGFNGSAANPGGAPINILDPAGANTPGGALDPAIADFTDDPTAELLSIAIESLASFGSGDTLEGGIGEDILDGGVGDDILTGGADADTFVFLQGTGSDTVTDFIQGEDVLDVGDIFANASDAVAASNVVGGNTVVDFGGGNSVTLLNVIDPLVEADFIVA